MPSFKKLLSFKHKNNKFLYYVLNTIKLIVPVVFCQRHLGRELDYAKQYDECSLQNRVNYYNGLNSGCALAEVGTELSQFKMPRRGRTYFFDSYEYARYFDPKLKANFIFGDVTWVPDRPSLVKSRPIHVEHANSVLMKLNWIRHFVFASDARNFEDKTNRLIWRAQVFQEHRSRFLEMYHGHPLCNVGQINEKGGCQKWIVPWMSIDEQLEYKFILCLEGNDVATNLKWVMSSNSIAVMPRPKYETWFMEGTLIPDHHYICIKDDYSDLEEKLAYYMKHTDEALQIIRNANRHVEMFKDPRQERLISFLVLQKYFHETGQI
jgi:hypothetical protein